MPGITIFYHDGCYDGFSAAWIASNQLTFNDIVAGNLPRTQRCVPCTYGDPLPSLDDLQDQDVYVLDFSFPRSFMIKMSKRAASLLVLDHHKTAQAECQDLSFCTFDMARSGAGLTWDHFQPSSPRPILIDYIEDRDLWRFSLKGSKEVHAWISSYPRGWSEYSYLQETLSTDLDACIAEGQAILRYENQKILEMVKEAKIIVLLGHEVPLVNCTPQFGSSAASTLLDVYPESHFAVYFWISKKGRIHCGLRSRPDGFDVSEIARTFGGGGHRTASGFLLEAQEWNRVAYEQLQTNL